MNYYWELLTDYLRQEDNIATIVRVVLMVVVGLPLTYAIGRWLRRTITRRSGPQQGLLASKIFVYLGFASVVLAVLQELNFPLAHLLGAAGVAGIALGFASQTSVSNIISGFFLMAEKPFIVGDVIKVGNTTGEILSIDTLSIKLRTFDNRYVRIPNETIIKSEIHNISRFPVRRVELTLGVAYKESIGRVREILLDLAHENPKCLQEPASQVILSGFGDSAIDIFFVAWVLRSDYSQVKNELTEEIKKRFDEEGIEIPFPHRSLYAGEATGPLPIRIVGDSAEESARKAGTSEQTKRLS